MHWILIWPDIRPTDYPANPKAGYRISSWISGEDGCRISGEDGYRTGTGYPAGYTGTAQNLNVF
jgi:hypothetical protein